MSRDTDNWADSRWMPPSPHKEAVLERMAAGRCHIESQGHGKPPLLVHEDGGVLELHKVRKDSRDLHADPDGAPENATKHVDVCGTIDEIEKWLKEEPDGAERDPERLQELLQHATGMCRRMERRWQAYQEFASRVAAASVRMSEVTGPSCRQIDANARETSEAAHAEGHSEGDYDRLVVSVERIRDVANGLEGTLRGFRDLATELAATYEDIRGARNWDKDVEERLAKLRGEEE